MWSFEFCNLVFVACGDSISVIYVVTSFVIACSLVMSFRCFSCFLMFLVSSTKKEKDGPCVKFLFLEFIAVV